MTSTHPKIIIRHIEARRSERVAWLLEELGISDYELDYIRGDVLGSLVELEKYHEMRMAPIVSFGDEVTMIESAAILEYILSRSDLGKGSSFRVGDDEPSYPAYLEFLHFAEGTAMPKIQIDVTENRARKMIKELGHEPPHIGLPKLPGNAGQRSGSQRILHYAESVLSKRKFFGGDRFTAAGRARSEASIFGGDVQLISRSGDF